MKADRRALMACTVLLVLLAACQKNPEPKVEAPAASVALPPKQMPPSDTSIPAASATAPSSGDAATPTQANPAGLTKEQEQTSMPHTGQTNTHSAPETRGEKK